MTGRRHTAVHSYVTARAPPPPDMGGSVLDTCSLEHTSEPNTVSSERYRWQPMAKHRNKSAVRAAPEKATAPKAAIA
jgi:hypothetical protein